MGKKKVIQCNRNPTVLPACESCSGRFFRLQWRQPLEKKT